MKNQGIQDFILLHMADSAFPTGAFAYSAGLEAMIEFGLVHNEGELSEYIYEFTRQAIAFDLPFLNSFYDLSNEQEALAEAAITYDATFVSAAMYEASINLGKNWMRIMEEVIRKESCYKPILQWLQEFKLEKHYLPLAVLSFKSIGFDLERVRMFHISSLIRDQVSAAIRLGVIGPMHGHAIQYLIYTELAQTAALSAQLTYKEARRTGFVTDVAQMLQKNVYSKLFKN